MKTTRILILAFMMSAAQAETLILPTHPGTGAVDITQPGIRIEGDTIYETIPGPLGIINPIGTTYKREGDEFVPHKGILGPQDFDKPSYQIQDEPGYRPAEIPQFSPFED